MITTLTINKVDNFTVIGAEGCDPIQTYWADSGPGAGYVTITCSGEAWTAYFGAMNGKTIQQFFAEADTDYMVGKLNSPTLKNGLARQKYLAKIVEAVKEALSQRGKL